ncbi:MAG: heavy metal translocating P-type ATPase [Eubacterium sp.]|nr:heavy metal translocating P-type ATPase [Eubacterium sp.]
MRFQILHRSPGRLRLRADVRAMSMAEADILDAWLHLRKGVDDVTVHERTCSVTICYHGEYTELCEALSVFSYGSAEQEIGPQTHSTRAMNREFKEKLVMSVIRHWLKRLLLPAPIRCAVNICVTAPRILQAAKILASGRMTVEVLDGIAIGASLISHDDSTAGSVHLLLRIGEILEEWTHKRSVDNLARSMSLQVDQVWVPGKDGIQEAVPLDQIVPGDLIIVHTGHVLPLDGILEQGEVLVNQASLTGESIPVAKRPGAAVYAGSVLEEGSCIIRVTHACGQNRYDRIVRMIEESERLKSSAENRASGIADRLVPWCLGGSLLTWLLTGNVTRAVSVLMVDFSCALKLSMPLAVLSAMREAGKHRITVKGGRFMEKICAADTVIFDKTGTLTRACPTVLDVVPFNGENKDEMLRMAACLEEHFPHSVANAVLRAAREKGLEHNEMHSEVEYIVAHGIATKIDGKRAVIGSAHFVFEDEGVQILPSDRERFDSLLTSVSWIYLGVGGILSAAIGILDPLRAEAAEAVQSLRREGIGKTVMLTGDDQKIASVIADQLGVDDYQAEILPEDKAAYIRSEQDSGRTVIMIGDGINDTPALSLADVGIAVGSGAVIAREVADVTIEAEDLHELVWLKQLSDSLMLRIRRNYRFVMGFNGALIALGAFGILPPAASAILHNTSTILLSLNSMTELMGKDRREGT